MFSTPSLYVVKNTKTLAIKKWLPFEPMCSILKAHSNYSLCWPYSHLLTLYVQYIKNLAAKSGFQLSL